MTKLNIGQVAFITGGWEAISNVELYSPLGDCQHSLAPLPVDLLQHIVFIFEDTIMACSGTIENTILLLVGLGNLLMKCV